MTEVEPTPGRQWRKLAIDHLVRRRLWTRVRQDVCKRLGDCIDEGKALKSDTIMDLVERHDVACQTLKLFWDAGLLRRKKGVGKSWLYYWDKHPPEFLRPFLDLDPPK